MLRKPDLRSEGMRARAREDRLRYLKKRRDELVERNKTFNPEPFRIEIEADDINSLAEQMVSYVDVLVGNKRHMKAIDISSLWDILSAFAEAHNAQLVLTDKIKKGRGRPRYMHPYDLIRERKTRLERIDKELTAKLGELVEAGEEGFDDVQEMIG